MTLANLQMKKKSLLTIFLGDCMVSINDNTHASSIIKCMSQTRPKLACYIIGMIHHTKPKSQIRHANNTMNFYRWNTIFFHFSISKNNQSQIQQNHWTFCHFKNDSNHNFVNTSNFSNSSISQIIQSNFFLTLPLVKKNFEKMLANAFYFLHLW
jgi:hypothetical protein